MLTYEDALERLLAATQPLRIIDAAIGDAAGLVLARDITARLTQPPFAASAMDGYAVRWTDLPGPWRVIGESAAGKRFAGELCEGEAVRIFTGAPVPARADTVVVQEDVRRDGNIISLTGNGPPHAGAHIRKAGKDFAAGDTLIAAGTHLSPAHIGLAAAAGHATLKVRRRPRIALIATGNELVPPGIRPADDQIVSSNGVMLRALFKAAGADVTDYGILPDELPAITAAFRQSMAAEPADLVVPIGGASVGDHDLVQAALKDAGAVVDFWKVAIKPGKPLIAGSLGGARVLGLPGNPVSAYVCAVLFALPVLRRMAGADDALPVMIEAPLTAALPANGDRRDHLRAVLDRRGVTPFTAQDSSMLSVLALANALVIRPIGAPAAKAGEYVSVLSLDRMIYAP